MNGSPHLTIGHQLRGESQKYMYEVWCPTYELKGPRYEELIMLMAECAKLALVTLLELKDHPDG